jgi:glycosyltransferase involved in cell wall biosynthesis
MLGSVRVSRPWTVWRARQRLDALLGRHGFDAVLTHGCWPHAVFARVARRRRLPVVFWAHGLQSGRHWLERWARRAGPDLVLANSRATRDTIANLFPSSRAEVLYLPVAFPDLPERESSRQEVRAALGAPPEAAVIIQASRLERWKGHELLLEALARLAGIPGWICWVVGGAQRPAENRYLAELESLAARRGIAGRVRFLGQRADVPQLLTAADIHCQPNTGPEPFGIAFVEALYAGLPVVTTALGGALEIVDPSCGVLVPPDAPEALAAALRHLVEQPRLRQRLGQGGPARAAKLCDCCRQLGWLAAHLSEVTRGNSETDGTGRPAAKRA